mgnify:CR=1 FL=1
MKIIKKLIEDFKKTQNNMYASPLKRLSGFIIDLLIIMIIFNATMVIANHFGFDSQFNKEQVVIKNQGTPDEVATVEEVFDPKTFNKVYTVRLIISAVYFVLFLSSKKQATIGNMVFNTMVVSTKMKKVTPIIALLRFIALLLNNTIFGLGYFTYFFTKDRSFLQDILSDSRIVNLKKD